jgi:hypothetical protein
VKGTWQLAWSVLLVVVKYYSLAEEKATPLLAWVVVLQLALVW